MPPPSAPGRDRWEVVVGLEVHAQLLCPHKLFVEAPASFAPDAPNTGVSPHCLGLPGVLPRLNQHAVDLAVRAAVALGCAIHRRSRFDRKHYFYPDLPKGYQITQYHRPFATDGWLEIGTSDAPRVIRIARIHLEEDAGKVVRGARPGRVGVDLNRAGVPLIEIVTAPDLRSGAEAAAASRELRSILTTLGVNDGNLEQGSLRCDANVSVRRRGETQLGARCEIKNVSGFRFLDRAIEHEAARHIERRERGEEVLSETRGFDASRRTTYPLRAKEDEPDYRYLPDPDLPELVIEPGRIEAAKAALPELPAVRRERWMANGLPEEHARVFAADPDLARWFDEAIGARVELTKAVGDLVKTELLARAADDPGLFRRLVPRWLPELADLRATGRVSSTQQKAMLEALAKGATSVDAALAETGGEQVGGEQLEQWVDEVLAQHPEEAASHRGGNAKVLGYLVGRVMRRSLGRADPRRARAILEARLSGSPK